MDDIHIYIYITIRLQARNFYKVVVNEGEPRVDYN